LLLVLSCFSHPNPSSSVQCSVHRDLGKQIWILTDIPDSVLSSQEELIDIGAPAPAAVWLSAQYQYLNSFRVASVLQIPAF